MRFYIFKIQKYYFHLGWYSKNIASNVEAKKGTLFLIKINKGKKITEQNIYLTKLLKKKNFSLQNGPLIFISLLDIKNWQFSSSHLESHYVCTNI